ncbi:hypothetical protein [Lysinibacillus sp. SGAir0095]|uniref:hypothetical protein n=1 Tax=Lysinibacillus sp. SGAir0095 TaxID=2070463 RepID=UPI0010CD31E2|nr:hypothetical protein [Lysinibacillus sp. SGAir0095]QCR33733.1 hypothetical protein C1N55_16935 [Lysinibacillus sp. SGAir0095]
MRKLFLGFLLMGGSFLFYDEVDAAELSNSTEEQQVAQTEAEVETIYFTEDQDILITDDVIIRRLSDSPSVEMANLSLKRNYINTGISLLGAGEWDLIGDEFVGSKSSIYPSHGGDYRVSLVQSKYGPYLYSLREHDTLIDTTVKNFNFSGAGVFEMIFPNISGYCDGDDGLAEFFIYKSTMQSTADYISFWD